MDPQNISIFFFFFAVRSQRNVCDITAFYKENVIIIKANKISIKLERMYIDHYMCIVYGKERRKNKPNEKCVEGRIRRSDRKKTKKYKKNKTRRTHDAHMNEESKVFTRAQNTHSSVYK